MISRAKASVLLFGGAALSALPSPIRAQTTTTIRVATQPIENAAEVFYAKDVGLFAKARLDADVQVLPSSSAIAAAVASNAVDVGFSTIDTLANIHQKSVPIVVIAPAAEYLSGVNAGIAAIVVPANSAVHQAADLNGKVIAAPALHSLAETAPRAWIDRNGGDSSTVKFVEIPFPGMPAALETGRVDAAFVVEPLIAVAKKNGRVLSYCYDAVSKHFLIAAWFTTPQWAKDHADLVRRFASVMRETAVWANKNPVPSGEILAKYTKIDPAVVAAMARSRYSDQLTPALVQPLIDVSAKYNGFSTFPARELLAL